MIRTMDELAQAMREGAALRVERRCDYATGLIAAIRNGQHGITEAAISVVPEHFEMVKVRRNMHNRNSVYLPGHGGYPATENDPAMGWDYFLIPKPEPEPDAVKEAARELADFMRQYTPVTADYVELRRLGDRLVAALDKESDDD